ncbi:MAG: D-mannonate oxidoreductase, partial [Verrucomicrobia bacterium TMED56]
MNELFNISEKVIVVTGATGILAGGAAKYLQRNGAKVVYLGRNQDRVNQALSEGKNISADCMGLTCDVLDEEALEKGYASVINKFGRID